MSGSPSHSPGSRSHFDDGPGTSHVSVWQEEYPSDWDRRSTLCAGDGGAVETLPLRYFGVPYYGPGKLEVSAEGALLLQLGLAQSEPAATEAPEVGIPAVEWLQLVFNPDGVSLDAADGFIFLDRDGRELQARALSEDRLDSSVTLGAPRHNGGKTGPILQLSGMLDLSYDSSSGLLSLTVYDDGSEGLVFNLDAEVRSGGGDQRLESLETLSVPGAVDTETPIVLYAGGEAVATSACNISCPRGSGSVGYTDSGCKCTCKSGKPTCVCTNIMAE